MSEKPDFIAKLRGPISTAKIFQPSERSCNRACISPLGDLLFVATEKIIVGYNLMTEVCFKIYNGHEGAIEDLDIQSDGTKLLSVGASQHIIVHNVEDGSFVFDVDVGKILRACCYADGAMNYIATVTSKQMKQKIVLTGYHLNYSQKTIKQKFEYEFGTPVNAIRWPTSNIIVAGDENGRIHVVDVSYETIKNGGASIIHTLTPHRGPINNITLSFDRKFFATASNDTTACLYMLSNQEKDEPQKVGTYNHNFIISCAAISPKAPHIVLASSADASAVARTSFGSTDFTINFFHTIFQEEFASMKVHKSTVNWVGFTPDGYTLVTTSFEGTVQVIRLGGQYSQLVRQHEEEIEQIKNSKDY